MPVRVLRGTGGRGTTDDKDLERTKAQSTKGRHASPSYADLENALAVAFGA